MKNPASVAIVERLDPVDEAERARWLDALDEDDPHAAAMRAGAINEGGFHGNAITCRTAIADPMLIRIEQGGSWFNRATDQPRVGGRMALAGRSTIPAIGPDQAVISDHDAVAATLRHAP